MYVLTRSFHAASKMQGCCKPKILINASALAAMFCLCLTTTGAATQDLPGGGKQPARRQTSQSVPAAEPSAGLTKGMQLVRQGKLKDALVTLQSAPLNATNYYYQAYCYYQLHHETEAKQLFIVVVEHFPASQEAALALGFLKTLDPTYKAPLPPEPKPARESKKSAGLASLQPDRETAKEANPDAPADLSRLPESARIFFTKAPSGHMIVDASVNGHPAKCMFDTGAPGLLFGMNNLRSMGVPLPQGPATTSVRGWAGVRLPAWEMNLTVKVAGIERTLPATIQEDLDLPPLIGYSFIRGYQYEIDQKAGCMSLKKEPGNQQSLNSLYDVPCQVMGTKPIVALEVNGKRIPAFIDTGAAMTIMNPLTAAAARIEIPADAPAMAAGGIGGQSLYRVVGMDLRLGPIIRKDFQVMIGGNAGNAIGQDFLQGWRFTVDEKKGYLRFFH
jgi:predicted aspartyl protease